MSADDPRAPHGPLSALAAACATTLGRSVAFCVAVASPYLFLGVFSNGSLAAMPLIVLGSMLTGWGLLIYPALMLGGFWYVREELSPRWLLVPAAVCSLDLWRVSHAFGK